jgi:hypothetical protein
MVISNITFAAASDVKEHYNTKTGLLYHSGI